MISILSRLCDDVCDVLEGVGVDCGEGLEDGPTDTEGHFPPFHESKEQRNTDGSRDKVGLEGGGEEGYFSFE